jgi:hypothetical protein
MPLLGVEPEVPTPRAALEVEATTGKSYGRTWLPTVRPGARVGRGHGADGRACHLGGEAGGGPDLQVDDLLQLVRGGARFEWAISEMIL